MVDTNTLVLLGCFAAAACVLFWLDRRHDEEIEPERRNDKLTTIPGIPIDDTQELVEIRELYQNVYNQ